MQRITLDVEPSKKKTYRFAVKSWSNRGISILTGDIKKTGKVFNLLLNIVNMPQILSLNNKFILKIKVNDTIEYRIGDFNIPLDKSLEELYQEIGNPECINIKLITPDKYNTGNHCDNPIYEVSVLMWFINGKKCIPPFNLHSCCPINKRRLGMRDNSPNNLILIIIPKGSILINMESACESFLKRSPSEPCRETESIIRLTVKSTIVNIRLTYNDKVHMISDFTTLIEHRNSYPNMSKELYKINLPTYHKTRIGYFIDSLFI